MLSHVTDPALRSIARRGTALWDRRSVHNASPLSIARAVGTRRLKRWQEILGGKRAWQQRMEFPCSPSYPNDAATSTPVFWASTLDHVIQEQREQSESLSDGTMDGRVIDPDRPLPFEPILLPFLWHARHELKRTCPGFSRVFEPTAIASLERQLLSHLTFVASMTLGREFSLYRLRHSPATLLVRASPEGKATTVLFQQWVDEMEKDGLVPFFDQYPVLGRLLAVSTEQWIGCCARLLHRLVDDLSALQSHFGLNIDRLDRAVQDVRTDLSDRHNGGQCVLELIFRSSERVIYKPRSVRGEQSYYRVVQWLNFQGIRNDLRTLRALDRRTYGWMESARPTHCDTTDDARRFFVRAGSLLATLHVLGVTDIHCENILACGPQPLVVDLETMLIDQPQLAHRSKAQVAQVETDPQPNVLDTGLLPRAHLAPDGQKLDMSGLCADRTRNPTVRGLSWTAVNTDHMTLSEDCGVWMSNTHRARAGETLLDPHDYLNEIVQGFSEAYRTLLQKQSSMVSEIGGPQRFIDLPLRTILRGTVTYALQQRRLLHSEFLQDGADRSIELEWMARPLTIASSASKDRLRIYETERMALERLDIPYFATSAWLGRGNDSEDADMQLLFAPRDISVLQRRLDHLSERECERQISYIVLAIKEHSRRNTSSNTTECPTQPEPG